ncbi:MAG: alkylated DNA repair dioxygenase AlkB [Flavobacteriales bacterium]|jgi:alkylated DNA repair dioxygenase AlkB
MTPEIIFQDGKHELILVQDFIDDLHYSALHSSIDWQEHHLKLFGKEVAEPRLSQWYGPRYTYSGKSRSAKTMPKLLQSICSQISSYSNFELNSVLANLYRRGQDSMGWHADNESEIDQELIASYSIGAERIFAVRDSNKLRTNIVLPSNSLLLMKNMQEGHQHAVPKTQKDVGPRINLTFRRVKTG